MQETKYKNELDINEILINIFVYFRKNFKIFLIFGLVGISVAVTKIFLSKPEFHTSMTAISEVDDNFSINTEKFYSSEVVINLINSIQKELDEKNYKYLSARMNIPVDSVKVIKSIEADYLYPISGTINEENKDRTKYLIINVSTSNINNISLIQKSILYFVNNDKFITERMEKQKIVFNSIIKTIDEEIVSIDSFKNSFYLNNKNSQSIMMMQEKSLFSEKIDLISRREAFKMRADEKTPLTVLTNFTKPSKNYNSLTKNLIIHTAIFILLAFIFLFFRDYYKKSSEVLKS